jgi:hypothetical protein
MTRPLIALAIGMCSCAGVTGAVAQTLYIDEETYAAPPPYVAPPAYVAVPRTFVAPPAYVAAPAYAVPVVPPAAVAIAPPAYVAVPAYAAPAAPAYVAPAPVVRPRVYADRPRVVRRVIVERTAPAYARYSYPAYDRGYGYAAYDDQ